MPVSGGDFGVHFLVFQQQLVELQNPQNPGCSCSALAWWFNSSPELTQWIESHPQREDQYAALRPFLVESSPTRSYFFRRD